MNQWSRKKQLKIAGIATGVIFLTAFTLGSGLYGLSRLLHLTESGSLNKLITQKIMANPELVNAYIQDISKKGCANQNLSIRVNFNKPIKLLDNPQAACSQFGLIGSNGDAAMIYMSKRPEAKEEVVRQIIASVTYPETNSLPHNEFEVTSVWGTRDHHPYQAYILAQDTHQTYLVEYFPADPAGLTAVKEMVKSIKKI
jgi:hypothetical protein